MDIKKSLNCIMTAYPKDFMLCHNFINSHRYNDILDLLNSLVKKETRSPKLSDIEYLTLLDLIPVFESYSINQMKQDYYDAEQPEDYPEDLFEPINEEYV